jgi:hypothetical protein
MTVYDATTLRMLHAGPSTTAPLTTPPKRPKDLAHVVQDMLAKLSSDREKQVARDEAAAKTKQEAELVGESAARYR